MRNKRFISGVLIAFLAVAGLTVSAPSVAHAATASRIDAAPNCAGLDPTVWPPLTAAQASVQPGVIVASPDPYGPTTYTAYTIDDTGHLQVIGPFNTIGTEDHLVAVWQSSTDCYGFTDSRNAWVADSSGSVFGQSDFSGPATNNFGDMGGQHLNQPVVGMTPTANGQGYWLVASDGGIFAFGDAQFHGSMGGSHLNLPITG